MQINTIITDLDDTLLNGETRISPYTLDIVSRLTAKGIRFIPASGRAASSMQPFVNQLNTGLPYIASNGAQVMDADHSAIISHLFTPEQARSLIRYFEKQGVYVQCYRDDTFFFASECEANRHYSTQTGMKGMAVGDLASFVDFSTPKVLSVADPATVEVLYPVIQKAFPDVSFTISKPHFLEAEPSGVSKGAALKQLSDIMGFSPETTMVFGDSLNDISMLNFTPNSVAMCNARDEVKQIAHYMTALPNTQDGLAHFIEDKLLS